MNTNNNTLVRWLLVCCLALPVGCGGGAGGDGDGEGDGQPSNGQDGGTGSDPGKAPGPGGGTGTGPGPGPGPGTGGIDAQAGALVASILDGASPEEAAAATHLALARGGIGTEDTTSAAEFPPASWVSEPRLAFNATLELRDRAYSGRFTLDDLANMWADFGFPFQGTGSPGEQLLGFLRVWLGEALVDANAEGHFPVLFIAEMARRQEPSVDLLDPLLLPADLRMSLLEIELLIAAFDRAFQPLAVTTATAGRQAPAGVRPAEVAVGICDQVKKLLGEVGAKSLQGGLEKYGGHLSDAALAAMGLNANDIKTLKGTMGGVFKALDAAMKVVKLIQIYASSQVLLTVEAQQPVTKPTKSGPRVLVPVQAVAGVPDAAWQAYQQHSGGQAYQNVKSCLAFAGMPLPDDLKDIVDKVSSWRIKWDLVKGSPKHALIPGDVNDFNAPGPFGMKLAQAAGSGSASATLQVDITEEPALATFFRGPYVEDTVRVKVEVFTAEPPSPTLLKDTFDLVGTLGVLLDLSVGWVQTGLPPASTVDFKVKFRPMPDALTASASIDMSYVFTHFRDEPPTTRHAVRGEWNAELFHSEQRLNNGVTVDSYAGTGTMNYTSASTQQIPEGGDDCTYVYATTVIDGAVRGVITPATNQNGAIQPDQPYQFAMGIENAGSAPQERETLTVTCPGSEDAEVTPFPPLPKLMVGALNALNLMTDVTLIEGGKLPGIALTNEGWTLTQSGAVEKRLTSAQTVSVVITGGAPPADTEVLQQNNVLRLTPFFASAP